MSVITRMLRQTAVYWARNDATDDYGALSWAEPVEIACRFTRTDAQAVNRKDSRNAIQDSPKQTSESVVYVDRDMRPGDVLLLGPLTEDTDQTNALANEGAVEVKRFSSMPNMRATEFLRKAYL